MASGDEEQVPWGSRGIASCPQEALRRPSTGQLLMSAQRAEVLISMIYEFLGGKNESCTLHDTEPGPGGAGMKNALPWAKGLSSESRDDLTPQGVCLQ